MTPAITTALPPAVPSSRRSDFADWLSPILVKELRQGLQSRLFVSVFVLVQASMILFVGLRLISQSGDSGNAAIVFDSLFAFCVSMPLLVFMPARGLGAIGEETKAQTLDLVQLTRLSSFRIVWGKWLALVAQTCLLATAMLPYAVLRYYFGQVDVIGEMESFGMLLITSMVLTAGAVGVSAAPVAVRILVLMMILPSLMTYAGSAALMRTLGRSGGITTFATLGVFFVLAWIVLSSALYIYFFLELAASKIAPLAENHSARKRLLALVLAAMAAGAGWFCSQEIYFTMCILFVSIVGYVVLEALCEMPSQMPGIYRPFVLRGWAGRCVGRLMYPGWPAGTLFTAVILALMWCGLAGWSHRFSTSPEQRQILSLIAPMVFFALISPLPLLQLFPRLKKRFWPYLLVQVLSMLVFTIAWIIADSQVRNRDEVLNFVTPIPTAALFAFLTHTDNRELVGWLRITGAAADGALLLWLGVLLFQQFRYTRKMERLSLGEDAPTTPEFTS